MRNFTNYIRTIIFAGLVMLGGISVSAQSYTEGADLPSLAGTPPTFTFGSAGTFTVSGTVMTTGDGQDAYFVSIPAGFQITSIGYSVGGPSSFDGYIDWDLTNNVVFAPGTGSGTFALTYPIAPGTYTAFVAANFSVGNSWSYTYTIAAIPVPTPPANDDVCNAIPLTTGVNGPYDNTLATIETGEVSPPVTGDCYAQTGWCFSTASNTIWFTYVASATGHDTILSPGFDTQLALWDAAACSPYSGFTLIAANDDEGENHGGASFSSWLDGACLTPGHTYYLQLSGNSGATGSTTINVGSAANQAPTLSACPADISGCNTNPTWTAPTATDPEGCTATVTSTHASGSTFPVGTTTVTYTATDQAGATATCDFTVTVNGGASTVDLVADQTVCNGDATNAVAFTGTGTSYNWTASNTSIGIASSGSGNIGSFTATNTGIAPVTSTITVTPSDACGAGTPTTFDITVNPTPTVNAVSDQTVCNGDTTTAITFTGAVAGTVYDWTGTDGSLGLPNSGSGDIASFIATNGAPVLRTNTITVTPTYTNNSVACAGTSDDFNINVNPTPTSTQSPVICQGDTFFQGSSAYTAAGTYRDTIFDGSSVSCDSVIVTTLTVTQLSTATGSATPATICLGGSSDLSITETGFSGAYAPASWTFSQISSDGTVDATNAPASITITSGDDGTSTNGYTLYSVQVPAAGNITFDWDYSTGDDPTTDYPVYAINGVYNPVPGYTFGSLAETGTATIAVSAGDVFALGAYTIDNQFGRATVIYSNFNGPRNTTVTWYDAATGGTAVGSGNPLTVTPATAGIDSFYAEVSNSGCANPARLLVPVTVNPIPTVNPNADQAVCNNGTTSVTFTGAVPGTVYDWTGTDATIGIPASGSGDITTFTATNTGITPVVDTIVVTPSYTNAGVTCTGLSDTFTITVNPNPTVAPSADQIVCEGGTVAATAFTGAVAGTVYDWTGTDGTIGIPASGSGDIGSFTALNTSNAPITDTLIVTPTFTNAGASCPGTPDTFYITVNPTPLVDTTTDLGVCNNGSVSVTFTGPVAGTVYDWTGTDGSIGIPTSGTGNMGPFTAINTGTVPVIDTIIVNTSFTNSGVTCTGASDTFTITVNPTPTVVASADQVVCNAAPTAAVLFTGAVAGTDYNWTSSDGTIGLPTTGSGDIASFVAINTGNAPVEDTIIVTPSYTSAGVTCTGTPDTFYITINPTPGVNAISDQAVCNNDSTTAIIFSGNVTGTSYDWTGTSGSIGLPTSGNGDIASFTGINTGSVPVIDTIIVTPSYNNAGVTCTGPSDTFTITVNPTPVITASADQQVCNGDTTSAVAFTSTVAGTTFAWTSSNATTGLPTSGTGNIPSFTAINATTSDIVDTIVIIPTSADGCEGVADTFTITIHPTPLINLGPNVTTCGGSVQIDAGNAGSTYMWSDGATTQIDTVSTSGIYTVTVTSIYGCIDSASKSVYIKPAPTVNLGPDSTYCGGSVTLDAGNIGASYLWSDGSANRQLTVNVSGAYSVTVTDTASGCQAYDTINLIFNTQPVVDLGPDTTLCGGSITLLAGDALNVYLWSPGGSTGNTLTVNSSGTYSVTVGYPNGCVATGSINVTVFIKPDLGMDQADSICPGSTADLYSYYQGTGLALAFSTTNPAAADQGLYRVIGTNSNGCSDTAYISITYREKPNLGADRTDSVCLGYTYNLRTLFPDTGYSSYAWSNTFNDTAVGPGTYDLVVINASGCTDTVSVSIINGQRPSLGGNKADSICRNTTYDLTALYPNTVYTSYSWTNVANPAAVGTGVYQLIVSNGSGCTDTAYATITSKVQPIVTLASINSVCSTVPAFFLTGGSPAGGTYFVNNVISSMFDPATIGSGPQSVVYVYTNGNGCTDSASTTITVYPQPVITNPTPFPATCTNSQAIDLNQYFAPNGGSYFGPGVSGQYFYPTLTGAGPVSITYIYTDSHGCVDTAVSSLTILDQVRVTLITNNSSYTSCTGDSVTFFASGATSYQFFVNGVAVTSVSDTSTFTTTNLQNHDQVTVVGSNGCSSQTSDMIIIDVNQGPIASAGNDTTIDLGQTVQLNGTATGGTGNLTYNWTPATGLDFSNVPNPKFNGADTTLFALRVTDVNGCSGTDSVVVNVRIPINVVLPNILTPNGDGQNDEWILNSKINLAGSHLVVFNRWGEKVFEANSYANNWKGTYMNTNDKLPDGTYYYVLKVPAQNNHEYTGPINLLSTQN